MAPNNKKLVLKGVPASAGIATGKARIITDAAKAKDFREGDILVTTITDPTMVSLMAKSAAIVCDMGSITSHPSIVSRELGIPCVVGTKKATTVLKNGMAVKVNGSKGEVYRLS